MPAQGAVARNGGIHDLAKGSFARRQIGRCRLAGSQPCAHLRPGSGQVRAIGRFCSGRHMPSPVTNGIPTRDRAPFVLICALLTLCFASGGDSQHGGGAVMLAELLALPVLLFAAANLWRSDVRPSRLAVFAFALIPAIPLLQLLPIPGWLWSLPSWRAQLQQDLAAAGVGDPLHRWSLAPAATERALWLLLPASALFLAALPLQRATLRWLLRVVIALAVLNLVLAIAQLGLAQDSFLNPYPEFPPDLGGVFANHNHQATMLAIALVLALAALLDVLTRTDAPGRPRGPRIWLFAGLALLFAMALPMAGSRAGILIVIVPVLAVVLSSGLMPRGHRGTPVIWLTVVTVLALALVSVFAWVQSESAIEAQRWAFNRDTLALALANSPLGSGVGSFVPVFQQGTETALQMDTFANHAHDEYPQWWLEAGWLGVGAIALALAALGRAVCYLLRLPGGSSLRSAGLAAAIAILVIALHSAVDYPLRTPALMALCGLLAGIIVAAAAQARAGACAAVDAVPERALRPCDRPRGRRGER